MNHQRRIRAERLAKVVLALCAACALSASPLRAQDEAPPIFDGKSLEGWEGDTNWFRVQDNAIVAGTLEKAIPHNFFLCTTREYGDFELTFEAKLVGKNQNGGVQLRSQRIPDHHEMIGYQCDVGEAGKPVWGALYDESRRNRFLAEADPELLSKIVRQGDWNRFRVHCEGPRVQIWLNGQRTVDFREDDPKVAGRGLIGLQIHGGPAAEVWYRDLRLKEIVRE